MIFIPMLFEHDEKIPNCSICGKVDYMEEDNREITKMKGVDGWHCILCNNYFEGVR